MLFWGQVRSHRVFDNDLVYLSAADVFRAVRPGYMQLEAVATVEALCKYNDDVFHGLVEVNTNAMVPEGRGGRTCLRRYTQLAVEEANVNTLAVVFMQEFKPVDEADLDEGGSSSGGKRKAEADRDGSGSDAGSSKEEEKKGKRRRTAVDSDSD